MSGKRKGAKVGHPRFRSKHGRQSIRLTRNGFALRGDKLYVAKVGKLGVQWSRDLPSAPSSVTIIKEADGRYYASFVVERDPQLLPVTENEVGIDVGLHHLATLSTGHKIEAPRFLRAAERRLAHHQRALSRKDKGSANRAKARRVVAVAHRKVREARLDHAHKLALNIVRDNQAIYVEDLAVAGLARTRLAKSIHDAGWAQLLRLIEEKAAFYGRTFTRIGRYAPSTQICSTCGAKTGPTGPADLGKRAWTCTNCQTVHDRDTNAATNILAWGHQERLNACGGQVRPAAMLAPASETGTHRSDRTNQPGAVGILTL